MEPYDQDMQKRVPQNEGRQEGRYAYRQQSQVGRQDIFRQEFVGNSMRQLHVRTLREVANVHVDCSGWVKCRAARFSCAASFTA